MSDGTKVSALQLPRGRTSINVLVDNIYFVFGGIAAIWLAWLVLSESFSLGWWQIAFFVLFWAVLAYLVLPRLHRILTTLYVPNYFIGRARTSDGLLGDPINLALLGDEEQLDRAMREAGWTKADALTLRSAGRIIRSTVLRRSYDEAPVSPLLLFERQQDSAYQQEVQGNPAKRHHVRFWRCPDGWLLPGGHHVDWLAAGTFDRSVGFSLFTLQITHKIDANTDIERDHIVSTLTTADEAIDVRVIRDFSTGYHSRNGGGDAIVTDGDLPVVDLRALAVAPKKVEEVHEESTMDTIIDRLDKRPLQTTLGAFLMMFRILAGIGSLVAIFLDWKKVAAGVDLDVPDLSKQDLQAVSTVVLWAILIILMLAILLYLLLALFVFAGKNWARIMAMGFSSLVIVLSAVDYFNGGPQITLRTNLVGLSFDILVLLALSSESARRWARRPRTRARDRRLARAAALPDS
jgi:hypothetical protein